MLLLALGSTIQLVMMCSQEREKAASSVLTALALFRIEAKISSLMTMFQDLDNTLMACMEMDQLSRWAPKLQIKITVGSQPQEHINLICHQSKEILRLDFSVAVKDQTLHHQKLDRDQVPTTPTTEVLTLQVNRSVTPSGGTQTTSGCPAQGSITCRTTWQTYPATRCQTSLTSGDSSDRFITHPQIILMGFWGFGVLGF